MDNGEYQLEMCNIRGKELLGLSTGTSKYAQTSLTTPIITVKNNVRNSTMRSENPDSVDITPKRDKAVYTQLSISELLADEFFQDHQDLISKVITDPSNRQ
jgi:hypothetical protein